MVIGVNEDMVSAEISSRAYNTNVGVSLIVGIGLDTTTAFSSGGVFGTSLTAVATTLAPVLASWKGFPGAGRHYLSWNEYSDATGTTTWEGDAGAGTVIQSGIHGELMG
jgi:hypothetical protein